MSVLCRPVLFYPWVFPRGIPDSKGYEGGLWDGFLGDIYPRSRGFDLYDIVLLV